MSHAVWTPLAEIELEDILFYIRVADGRPETARRIGQEIQDRVEQQAAHSGSGHQHKAAPEGWLYFQHKRWLIFYQPHPKGIEVMRIVDAARDLPNVLRG
jgi:plasmid stabilization system protein ParE